MKKYIPLLILIITCNYLQGQNPVIKLPHYPNHIVVNSKDEIIFTCDDSLMKITSAGKLSTITNYPGGISMTIDKNDNIYCGGDRKIWKVTPEGKIIAFAGYNWTADTNDGPLSKAGFDNIEYITVDTKDNIYTVEGFNIKDVMRKQFRIRKIGKDNVAKTILYTYEHEELKSLGFSGMCFDSSGNMYITSGQRCLKKISTDGKITTIAGLCGKREFMPVYVQGDISKAELMTPNEILMNKKGEIIFTDPRLNRLIKLVNNKVSTLAGDSKILPNSMNIGGSSEHGYKDGAALTALFSFDSGGEEQMAIDSKQNIYIVDNGNYCIRKLSADGMVTTIALFNPKEYKRQ